MTDLADAATARGRPSYNDLAYDAHVRARQHAAGAGHRVDDRPNLDGPSPGGGPGGFAFEGVDKKLIREADVFFLASVTGAGWPYVQHKGGPAGFVHVLGDRTLAFPDFPGNQQYVSAGNIDRDGRVCLFFVDFPTRRRLKVFGTARAVEAADDPELIERLRDLGAGSDREIRATIERAIVVDVTAVDANCAKHIKPRWDRAEVDARIDLYRADITELRDRVTELDDELAATRETLAAARAELAEVRGRLTETGSPHVEEHPMSTRRADDGSVGTS